MTKRLEKEDPQSCWNKAKEDELMFILLERDICMADTIRYWVERRIKTDKNKPGDPQIKEALNLAEYVANNLDLKQKEQTLPNSNLGVEGIVAYRNNQPYVLIFHDKKRIAQLSIAEAHKVALDILTQAARMEADAMIHKFFDKENFPPDAGIALMLEFRKFRLKLDEDYVEGTITTPSGDLQ